MITPDLAAEPTVVAASEIARASRKPIPLGKKLLLVIPLPIGYLFLVQGLALIGDFSPDPLAAMGTGLVRGLHFMGALSCFYLSLRTLLVIRRGHQ